MILKLDLDGRALLVNAKRGVVLHHFNFQKPVKDIQFSPNGLYVPSLTVGRNRLQISIGILL